MEAEIERAMRLVRKDHKQRWVYLASLATVHITEQPVPYRDAVSVYWMPIQQCVAYSYRPRALANDALGGVT
jgi:hypothetical protein